MTVPIIDDDSLQEERIAQDVARATAGDRQSFEKLYRVHVNRVFALCVRMTNDRSSAEELTQDVFVRAWQKLSRDVLADYRRAFKEEPGRLLSYGVMSDTDNTGETVEAWYGEISFQAASADLRPRATSIPASSARPTTK